jgi:hypothetical protein
VSGQNDFLKIRFVRAGGLGAGIACDASGKILKCGLQLKLTTFKKETHGFAIPQRRDKEKAQSSHCD